MQAFIFISIGSLAGAFLRFGLGLYFNPIFPVIPLGTLFANLLGGYIIGLITGVGLFSEALRYALITGFLGSLTTFSTFSSETITLFLREEYFWAIIQISLHVGGSLFMTFLGLLTIKLLQAN